MSNLRGEVPNCRAKAILDRNMGNTTWYRERRIPKVLADPVASSSYVEPLQRAQRGGLLSLLTLSLRYVLISQVTELLY